MANLQSNFTYTQIEQALSFALNQVAPVFSTSETYAVDDFVVYDGLLYQCIESCSGTWDAAKWQIQKIFDNNGFLVIKGNTAPTAHTVQGNSVLAGSVFNVTKDDDNIVLE